MNIQTAIVPITWLTGSPHGYACGYIGVPKEHPWYEKDYDDIECTIHGGLTYVTHTNPATKQEDTLWWVGFDTAHGGDNRLNCGKTYCENEVESLKQQASDAK